MAEQMAIAEVLGTRDDDNIDHIHSPPLRMLVSQPSHLGNGRFTSFPGRLQGGAAKRINILCLLESRASRVVEPAPQRLIPFVIMVLRLFQSPLFVPDPRCLPKRG